MVADAGLMIPTHFNLARHCLEPATRATPDKTALIVVSDVDAPRQAERWTYAELDIATRRVAAGLLATGLRPGDRIMLRLPNTSDYALLFFGAIAAGLVPIPVSAQLTEAEVAFLLDDCQAAAIAQVGSLAVAAVPVSCRILDETAIGRLKASPPAGYADTEAEAPAYMIYTSGTSTRPKGVVHAHRTALGRVPMHGDWQGLTAGDVMLHAGAFNWSYTLASACSTHGRAGPPQCSTTAPRTSRSGRS